MKHHTGSVERVLGRDIGRETTRFQNTKKNNGLNIHIKTNTSKLLRT